MKKNSLYDKLIEYGREGNYGFHMPGHKRNGSLLEGMDPFDIDITEINAFDNLHHAEGIIKESMENAAEFFGTDRTWFLVNGSSCGILAAVNAVTDIGDHIIIGRNCHKSVYNAVELRNLQVDYLYPDYIEELGINGGYNPKDLEELLKINKEIKAVVITSPTYDGIVSDVRAVAEIAHQYGAVLIVDEAHGAHFGITSKLPKPAYQQGADLVVESIHKTLPSLTQTALLHLCGDRIADEKIEECLAIYESSSPSYVLMASIDKCIRQLQKSGKKLMEKLLITDSEFRKIVNNLQYIFIPGTELKGKNNVFDIDETKLIIYVDSAVCDGQELADILREKYHFEMEMSGAKYVLGITTVCDEKSEILRLAESLKEIDKEFKGIDEKQENRDFRVELLANKSFCSIYQAKKSPMESINLSDSAGYVSGEYLYLYPPGIPLLVPGEVISERLLEQIRALKKMKMNLQGLRDKENIRIKVLK